MGDGFQIGQPGARSPARGSVFGIVVGKSGKMAKHMYLQGDRVGVHDVDPGWMANKLRRSDDIVRSRKLTCNCHCTCVAEHVKKSRKKNCACTPPCKFQAQQLYTHKDVRLGTVQLIVHGTHANVAPAPAPAVTRLMRRDINGQRQQGKAPREIEQHLRATYDGGDPLGENAPSILGIKTVCKSQKAKPRSETGMTLCETDQLAMMMTRVLKPGLSSANGELIMWDAPNLEVSRDSPGGSYMYVYILNREDALSRMSKGRGTIGDDAEEKQVPGSSVCHFAILEDAEPNPNRPGCPVSETAFPLAIALTDHQGSHMLAGVLLAIEMYRNCATPGCSNPKRLIEKPGGSYQLVRGCNCHPPAPFARHRADLYRARYEAMAILAERLIAVFLPFNTTPDVPELDPCHTHDICAQYDKVFSSGWVVNEGVTPNQGNYGLGLLSKACKKCPFENVLAAVMRTFSGALRILFPEDQVRLEMYPYYINTRYNAANRQRMTDIGVTRSLGMRGAKDRHTTTNPLERMVQAVEVEGGNCVQGPPGTVASKVAGRDLHGGRVRPIGGAIVGRMRGKHGVSTPNLRLDGQWRGAAACLLEGRYEVFDGDSLTDFGRDGFPVYVKLDDHGVAAYICPYIMHYKVAGIHKIKGVVARAVKKPFEVLDKYMLDDHGFPPKDGHLRVYGAYGWSETADAYGCWSRWSTSQILGRMVADDVSSEDVRGALGQLAVKFLEQERLRRALIGEEKRIVAMSDYPVAGSAMAKLMMIRPVRPATSTEDPGEELYEDELNRWAMRCHRQQCDMQDAVVVVKEAGKRVTRRDFRPQNGKSMTLAAKAALESNRAGRGAGFLPHPQPTRLVVNPGKGSRIGAASRGGRAALPVTAAAASAATAKRKGVAARKQSRNASAAVWSSSRGHVGNGSSRRRPRGSNSGDSGRGSAGKKPRLRTSGRAPV